MSKYVTYIRTDEGIIERKPAAIVTHSDESLDPYTHEEPLVGWPESRVYWANKVGPSVGIAPLNSTA
ncbi:hypothetical protein [Nitrosospira sp. NpAV]|uniref:hypothetical protein n=1 Tax=Nitrosospira sp. NpAV TaxID=58133 RepID=UPI00059F5DBA|nr:hypothetical protein [Nitrosospira sp. NpAV]KIO48437.1 hypothetical protein SQ11_11915 [Nitrosospira sp. NpAV]